MDEDVPSQEELSEDVKPRLGLISDVCLGPLEEVDLVAEAAVVVKGPKTKRKKNARRRKMKVNITAVRLHVYLVFVKSIEQELKIQ